MSALNFDRLVASTFSTKSTHSPAQTRTLPGLRISVYPISNAQTTDAPNDPNNVALGSHTLPIRLSRNINQLSSMNLSW
jgi:hypothetical protein